MTHFIVSRTGDAINLAESTADRLNEIAKADLIDELADTLAEDAPILSEAAAPGTLTLALKGSGHISIKILPGPTYELKGTLGFTGRLKAPATFGLVSATGQKSCEARMQVKFQHPENTRLLEALSLDLPVIAALNHLASLAASPRFKSAKWISSDSLRLTESTETRSARSLSIGTQVRVKGLRGALAPFMEEVARLPEQLKTLVQTYSEPNALI